MRVAHADMVWDIVTEVDVVERRSRRGKCYCDLCEPAELFASREALWIGQCFGPLLRWSNENFLPSRWLYLYGIPNHYGFARLSSGDNVKAAKATELHSCRSGGAEQPLSCVT